MIQQIFAKQSALSRSEVFWFSFRYPKDFFFLQICPAQSHSLCPHDPWDFSLQIHFFVFFSAYLFQMGSDGKKNFRSFGVQICTTPIQRFFNTLYRSDGFLALQIRRFFAISDPTVFGHPRSDGFFTTQFPMDF